MTTFPAVCLSIGPDPSHPHTRLLAVWSREPIIEEEDRSFLTSPIGPTITPVYKTRNNISKLCGFKYTISNWHEQFAGGEYPGGGVWYPQPFDPATEPRIVIARCQIVEHEAVYAYSLPYAIPPPFVNP